MKKLLIFLLAPALAHAQITIDNNDMPSPGDTFRVSLGLITNNIDPTPTGANHTWNYDSLLPIAQTVDTFLSVNQTNPTYSVVFVNLGFNPNRANLAAKGNFSLPPGPGITVTDIYSFYYNSSSQFRQSGFGAHINGIATPVPFDNKDIIYNFPLDFNDTDSSDSDLSLNIPGLGYYGYDQKRVNVCDGWGTLITPFGSFPTLRVRSTLYGRDTIHIAATGIGFGQDRPVTNEYKWLGANSGIPLLEITTNIGLIGGQENVVSIRYRDSLRSVLGVPDDVLQPGVTVFPVPASDAVTVDFNLRRDAAVTLTLLDGTGRQVQPPLSDRYPAGQTRVHYPLGNALAPGFYFLGLAVEGKRSMFKILIREL